MAIDNGFNEVCKDLIKEYKESGMVITYMGVPIDELDKDQLLACVIEANKTIKKLTP